MPVPFFGKEFTFTQPDGTKLQVRGWGNQQRAVFETLDGYTVIQDPATGFYEYARPSDDGEVLQPVGARPGVADPRKLGLKAGARESKAAAKAQAAAPLAAPGTPSRWQVRRQEEKLQLQLAMAAGGIRPAPPKRATAGQFVGLCLLIQFPDVPATITPAEVNDFLNTPGYNGYGNHGSVYDYYYDVSCGKVQYSTLVAPYYTAKHPRSYYTNEVWRLPLRAWELIKEALASLKASHFDFSTLSVDSQGYVYAMNVFYAGPRVNNWSKGLWPHSGHLLTPSTVAPGKQVFDYQITDMGSELALATYCHENGHMLCDFPDLYDYGYQSNGSGVYCLMAGGASLDPKNPTLPCAYLRYRAGWAGSLSRIAPGSTFTADASRNEFFLHEKTLTEYFIIENRFRSGRDQWLTDSGLAIWHVDELGSNNDEQMTKKLHYECALEQADGKFDLEKRRNQGDDKDLFKAAGVDRFADATTPSSKWWDGKPSGLDVHDVGPAGPQMLFKADCARGVAAPEEEAGR